MNRPPASRWYWIAALLISLAGLADCAVFVTKNLDNLVGSLIQMTVPGTVELTFTKTGPYTIFMEADEQQPTAKLNVRLVSPKTGAFVNVDPVTTPKFYIREDRLAVAVKEFRIEQPGPYEMAAFFSASPREIPATLTIGYSWGERFLDIFVTGMTGLLAWMTVAGVVAAIPFIRKRPADAQPGAAAPSDTDSVHLLRFHGSGGELFGIFGDDIKQLSTCREILIKSEIVLPHPRFQCLDLRADKELCHRKPLGDKKTHLIGTLRFRNRLESLFMLNTLQLFLFFFDFRKLLFRIDKPGRISTFNEEAGEIPILVTRGEELAERNSLPLYTMHQLFYIPNHIEDISHKLPRQLIGMSE